ncbi:short neuropeptide F precursor [Amblyomma americanum]
MLCFGRSPSEESPESNKADQMASAAATATRCLVLLLVLQAALGFPDYKEMRDLYEMMAKGEQDAHAMERKAARTPSMRLRFGRRSDPAWNEPRVWDGQRAA